jgi:hypothetical protein
LVSGRGRTLHKIKLSEGSEVLLKYFPALFAILALSGCLYVRTESLTPGTPDDTSIPDANVEEDRPAAERVAIEPNILFPVEATSGNCPETVGIWEFLLGFEGGADHTVVADFAEVAVLPIDITEQTERRIVYTAPLREEFASCTGTARSEALSMYTFYFEAGQVRFELDLRDDQGFREIRYADTSANRPYIHWRAAE